MSCFSPARLSPFLSHFGQQNVHNDGTADETQARLDCLVFFKAGHTSIADNGNLQWFDCWRWRFRLPESRGTKHRVRRGPDCKIHRAGYLRRGAICTLLVLFAAPLHPGNARRSCRSTSGTRSVWIFSPLHVGKLTRVGWRGRMRRMALATD